MTAHVSVDRTSLGCSTVALSLRGEIDLSNAAAVLEEVVEGTIDASRVILDLDGLDYVDSQGVAMLFELAHRFTSDDRSLSIVASPGTAAHELFRHTPMPPSVPVGARPDRGQWCGPGPVRPPAT